MMERTRGTFRLHDQLCCRYDDHGGFPADVPIVIEYRSFVGVVHLYRPCLVVLVRELGSDWQQQFARKSSSHLQ